MKIDKTLKLYKKVFDIDILIKMMKSANFKEEVKNDNIQG